MSNITLGTKVWAFSQWGLVPAVVRSKSASVLIDIQGRPSSEAIIQYYLLIGHESPLERGRTEYFDYSDYPYSVNQLYQSKQEALASITGEEVENE